MQVLYSVLRMFLILMGWFVRRILVLGSKL